MPVELSMPVTRPRAAVYALATAIEVGYILHANIPSLFPEPCRRESLRAACFFHGPFPWLWLSVAVLLLLSAIAVLLRKEAGVAFAFVAQALAIAPFVRDMVNRVGGFLFTGSLYSGVDSDYRDLASIVLMLSIAFGPALTALLLMSSTSTPADPRAARIAAILLSAQVAVLAVAAVVVFRATFRDCEHGGLGTVVTDGIPGCPDYADLDVGSVVASVVPGGVVMSALCFGVWFGRGWAIAGGIVWQVLLGIALAVMGVSLFTQQSQNAWYDWFPMWTSPRDLAYALMIALPVPTLAALLAAHSQADVGNIAGRRSGAGLALG